ncbi:MAG: hypothetical protein A2X49_01375 [Lentisphaerae bacterium GWF2_52_8]|nr:MAG: hypothetical protein A2X49_01375 [Lentisphaerae bacterium GWF2_52_8]
MKHLRKIIYLFIALAVVAAGPAAAGAQQIYKIALVDFEKIFANYPETKIESEKFAKDIEEKKKKLEKDAETIKNEMDRLERGIDDRNLPLSAAEKKRKEEELRKKYMDLQEKAESVQKDMTVKEQEVTDRIQKKILAIVETYSKENKIDVVIDTRTVYYSNPDMNLDITDEILTKINIVK